MQWSGEFAVKDFSIYNTNQSEENLVVENQYDNNSRFTVIKSGIAPYDFVTPAVFVNNEYYAVDMYEDGQLIETRVMKTGDNYHSASYAESAAENWALGYM